jgi:hypothetical protein
VNVFLSRAELTISRPTCTAIFRQRREYRNCVDGVLEGAAQVHLAPQSAGRTSVGTRINRHTIVFCRLFEWAFGPRNPMKN